MSDNFFGNNIETNLEQEGDVLGGGFSPLETDVYPVVINVAYLTKSPKGASALVLEFTAQGETFTRSITTYMTKTSGENYYIDKESGGKRMMPGWALADSISMMVEGKSLLQAQRQEKQVEIYNVEARKKLPTTVPVFVNWLGKPIYLAITKELRNKYKDGAPTAELAEGNVIDKAFHSKTKQTLSEALKKEEPGFFDKWSERNKGTVRDRSEKNIPSSTAPGRPASASAPEANSSQAASDLFG